MSQAELNNEVFNKCLQQAEDVVKDYSILNKAGHQTCIQESRSTLATMATCIGYLLNHFSVLKILHATILQDFWKACAEPVPGNVPTVKLPNTAQEAESSQTAETISV